MKPITVWFNQHFSNTWQSIALIRRFQSNGEFVVGCSHIDKDYIGREFADFFEIEPRGIRNSEYVDFCLDLAGRRSVDVFWPWRRIEAICKARERFEALGVKLIFPTNPELFELLQSKANQYKAVGSHVADVPDHAVVNTVTEFDRAAATLREHHPSICYKPAVSMFGWGFRILGNSTNVQESGIDDSVMITIEQARNELGTREPFKDLLVMPVLPGPERSVDCLADHGKLVRCIIRKKHLLLGNKQIIETNADIEEVSRKLIAEFQLNGVVNIQFRDYRGKSYLLEINPRMSGGVPYCDVTGLHLPYWAVRLATGHAGRNDIPFARTGIEIDTAAELDVS